jgi:hypothetical protein
MAPSAHGLRDEQAGLARRETEAIEQAAAALHGVLEIGTLAIRLADEAGRQVPVAGGERQARAVDEEQRGGARRRLQVGKVIVDARAQGRVARGAQQGLHVGVAGRRVR